MIRCVLCGLEETTRQAFNAHTRRAHDLTAARYRQRVKALEERKNRHAVGGREVTKGKSGLIVVRDPEPGGYL